MSVFGIISDPGDPHGKSVAACLEKRGHNIVLIDSGGAGRFSFEDGTWLYRGEDLRYINVYYFRNMLSPLPPAYFEGEYKLYKDWYVQYMHAREIFGVQLSWLYALQAQGKIIVNPPTAAGIGVLKPHQLFVLKNAGFPLPATLITNDPDEAKTFLQKAGKVIYKPAMGGAFTEVLDEKAIDRLSLIKNQYVIFQEFIEGKDIRVTATEDEVLSVAELESQAVDFRATPGYIENQSAVIKTDIPDDIAKLCLRGLKKLGLGYSGIDFKLTNDGRYILLEYNLHPAFLWIEHRLKAPISDGLAKLLIKLDAQAS